MPHKNRANQLRYNNERRARLLAEGKCHRCGGPLAVVDGVVKSLCVECRNKKNEKDRAKVVAARETGEVSPLAMKMRGLRARRKAAGVCKECYKNPIAERSESRCETCLEKNRLRIAEWRQRCLDHYGRSCATCGEVIPEFLTIDHVNGGGNAHRKQVGSGWKFFRWLVNQGFPGGYRVLCWNCNCRKIAASPDTWSCRLKRLVVNAYGGRCVCCGITDLVCLTMDHANGDGAKHRRESGCGSGSTFWSWLKRNGYPAGFQVLCWNCNCGKRDGAVCPHKLKADASSLAGRQSQGAAAASDGTVLLPFTLPGADDHQSRSPDQPASSQELVQPRG